jgi:hypothetical protein
MDGRPYVYISAALKAPQMVSPEFRLPGHAENLLAIAREVEEANCIVSDPHVCDPTVASPDRAVIVEEDLRMFNRSQVMIVEGTYPSTGCGFELAYAVFRQMPVLILVRADFPGKISAFVDANPRLKGQVVRYSSIDELLQAVDEFLHRVFGEVTSRARE